MKLQFIIGILLMSLSSFAHSADAPNGSGSNSSPTTKPAPANPDTKKSSIVDFCRIHTC